MADGGKIGGKPMPPMGDPAATHCRHCGDPRLVIRGKALMCETCDAPPPIDGVKIRPTWKQRFS